MAAVRQPFAPLDGARLQTLTSLKNRQNAAPTSPVGKRKAELLDTDDFENVDPLLFAKRAKGSNATPSKDNLKPTNYILKAATPAPSAALTSPSKAPASTPRRTLQPKSPVARLNTAMPKSSPIAAPAGRSPTRGKRAGIVSSRRRTIGPYSRVDPPAFNVGAPAPFSLDAALKGTIPSYEARPKPAAKEALAALQEPDLKASWFFDIHEDTPEQEMTNLLQHGTCVLDISSDEESEQKARRDKDEGRDKENIPPVDDVSQTSARRAARLSADDMVVEKERVALGEMNTADYYAEGCDESSFVTVPADDDEQPRQPEQRQQQPAEPAGPQHAPIVDDFEFAPELKAAEAVPEMQHIDVLMAKAEDGSAKAAVLQPMEGTGESFDLWESGSNKDDGEAVAAEPAVEATEATAEAQPEAAAECAVENS